MQTAIVTLADQRHTLDPGQVFQFGRVEHPDRQIVGLDADDLGISRLAGAIEYRDGVWVLTNLSSTTSLYVDPGGGRPVHTLQPGEAYLLDGVVGIEVRGQIRMHRIEVRAMASVRATRPPDATGRATVVPTIRLTDAERDALTALFSGYLREFPRRTTTPLSYAEAGELLGLPGTTVRRRIEHIREKLKGIEVYIEGPHAQKDLAAYVLDRGLITPADLERLDRS